MPKSINENKNAYLYTKTLHLKSRIVTDLGKYDAAIELARRSLEYYKKANDSTSIAAINNIIGVAYYLKSDLDSTLFYYEKAYKQKRKIKVANWDLAISAYNLGIVYEDLALYDKAIEFYLDAVRFLKKDKNAKATFVSDIYLALANTYNHKRNLVKALEYAQLALQEGQNNYGKDNPNMSFVYESNASLYKQLKDYDTAKNYIVKAIKIREKYYGKNHKWTAQGYSDLSEIFLGLQKNKNALFYINKAIAIQKRNNNKLDLADFYFIQSKIYFTDKRYQESLKSVVKSRKFYHIIYGKKHKNIAETWLKEVKIHQVLNHTDKIEIALQKVYDKARYKPENLKIINAPFIVLEALQITFEKANESEKIRLINQQLELINFIKRFYQSDEAKLNFLAIVKKITNKSIQYCFEKYSSNKNSIYLEQAFKLMQYSTNSILANEIQNANPKFKDTSYLADYKKLGKLKQNWSKIKQDLYYEDTAKYPNKKNINTLIFKRVELSAKIDSIYKILDKSMYVKKQNFKIIPIRKVQNTLQETQQLLEYYVSDTDIYILFFTKDKVEFSKIENKNKIQDKVNDLRQNIVKRTSLKSVQNILYNTLIAKNIDGTKPNVTLIVNDFLAYIPFEILKNNSNELLLSNFEIRYLPAISLLKKNKVKMRFKNKWLGFSNSDAKNSFLPKSNSEIIGINKIIGGTYFLDSDASVRRFKSEIPFSKMLHLALHSKINKKNPLYNELVFGDNNITASEIYSQKINCDLVVLSACETGYGTIQKGEGVMSFSRAFSYAGAKSTVTSLWKVPDSATEKLMLLFYKYLNEGKSKARALQQAKLAYLKNTADTYLKHPYYWSGFVLSGDASAIEKSNAKSFLIPIFISLLFLFASSLFVKLNNK